MKIILNKTASVLKNIPLTKEVEISSKIPAKEGSVIAVQVMEEEKLYNKIELTTGKFSTLHKDDILAVALGNRSALKGFVGHVPKKIRPGDIIQILNLGGVAGICNSENTTEVGHAINVKVLGGINYKKNSSINIKDFRLFKESSKLSSDIPLIIVSGTCMNSGKTTVASEIIKQLSNKEKTISAAKLAGIAALKDIDEMKNKGAKQAISFIDAGYTSTVNKTHLSPKITKGAIEFLAKNNPDFIVIEFGDGILGEYGVMDILKDKQIQSNIIEHIGCAHDPVGAIKLSEICEEIGAPLTKVSGPVTDNSVGIKFIEKYCKIPGINALSQNTKLIQTLIK